MSHPTKRVIPSHVEKNFITEVDGFVYYWPDGGGHYSSYQLRQIADELDMRNSAWSQEIEEYFSKKKE